MQNSETIANNDNVRPYCFLYLRYENPHRRESTVTAKGAGTSHWVPELGETTSEKQLGTRKTIQVSISTSNLISDHSIISLLFRYLSFRKTQSQSQS